MAVTPARRPTTRAVSAICALFVDCTLKPPPALSHTQGLIDRSRATMDARGVPTDVVGAVDHDTAPGVHPDMTRHGFASDGWPALCEQVMAADVPTTGLPTAAGST
ncbi:hypothetical protein [Streptomyces hilarionis]|uniref:hypothetical protein n=1 Tax=Streptomyces hilarionis TaxID=2839954 RepID=UPI00211A2786|nr:hypothetical protein [Streptomyces hilarionis]